MRSAWIAVFFCFVSPLYAADFDAKPIDEVVEKSLSAFQAPGASVVIVQDGEVVYLKGFGVRKKGEPDKITPDTLFEIASCTKAFTATLVALLVDEGKLKWDDKVHDHLAVFRLSDELADREVTFRDMLSHRTGMPRHDLLWAGRDLDTEELIRRWAKGKLSTSFRSTWEYSNVPFTTAGYVAGKLSGSDWPNAMKKRIFEPLGMTSTSCTAKDRETVDERATPHYRGFDKSIKPIAWDEIDHAGGAGSINSTARDMSHWLQFQLAGGKFGTHRLIPEKALKETHSPQMILKPEGPFATFFPKKTTSFTNYGLGWFVHDYRGHVCLSHGGTLTGFRAQIMMIPEKKIGVCVLCNLRPSLVAESICKSVLDHSLGIAGDDWVKFHVDAQAALEFQTALNMKKREAAQKKNTKPSLPLAKYAGDYEEPAYGKAIVKVKDDVLTVKWGKYTFRLDHYHFDTFTAVPLEPADEVFSFDRSTFDVQFRLGTDGEVENMKFLDQTFTRKK